MVKLKNDSRAEEIALHEIAPGSIQGNTSVPDTTKSDPWAVSSMAKLKQSKAKIQASKQKTNKKIISFLLFTELFIFMFILNHDMSKFINSTCSFCI